MYTFSLTAPAGKGLETFQAILLRIFSQYHLSVSSYITKQNRIRGGENILYITLSQEKESSVSFASDIHCFFQKKSEKPVLCPSFCLEDFSVHSQENIVLLGILQKYLSFKNAQNIFLDFFAHKKEIHEDILSAFSLGQTLSLPLESENILLEIQKMLSKEAKGECVLACDLIKRACIQSGLSFFPFYPMTPATGIPQALKNSKEVLVFQAEDEISVIQMALGASFSGKISATATSGGGFDLMTESLSFAGQAEIPLVLFLAQRPGPATGMPTHTAQEDINITLYSGHGEFPRLVLSPSSFEECFSLTSFAFALSQKYRIPCMVLLDEFFLAVQSVLPHFSYQSLISYPKETPEPISRANSYEHTAQGIITEDIQEREQILTKRKEKEVFLQKEIEEMWYSSKEELHSVVFVSTGSPVFAIKTAMKSFSHISLFLIPVLSPLPHSFPQLDGKTLIFVEQNTSGQLESLIKPRVNAKNIFSLRKNNGDPMLPEDIVEFFLSLSL